MVHVDGIQLLVMCLPATHVRLKEHLEDVLNSRLVNTDVMKHAFVQPSRRAMSMLLRKDIVSSVDLQH